MQDYIGGMVDAGFHAVHQIKSGSWQSIDGIHFLSVTLTGYRLPPVTESETPLYATLRGPFSSVTDELGQQYRRGIPQSLDARSAQLLRSEPLRSLFLIGPAPVTIDAPDTVSPHDRGDATLDTGTLDATLPKLSWNVIRLTRKRD